MPPTPAPARHRRRSPSGLHPSDRPGHAIERGHTAGIPPYLSRTPSDSTAQVPEPPSDAAIMSLSPEQALRDGAEYGREVAEAAERSATPPPAPLSDGGASSAPSRETEESRAALVESSVDAVGDASVSLRDDGGRTGEGQAAETEVEALAEEGADAESPEAESEAGAEEGQEQEEREGEQREAAPEEGERARGEGGGRGAGARGDVTEEEEALDLAALDEMALGDLDLVDTELAEHQRWGGALDQVGEAGSADRALFVLGQIKEGFVQGFQGGAGMGLGIGLLHRGLGSQVTARVATRVATAMQGVLLRGGGRAATQIAGNVLGRTGAASAAAARMAGRFGARLGPKIATQCARFTPLPAIGAVVGGVISFHSLYTRDWRQTAHTISQFGEGGSTYEKLANSIAAISEIVDIVSNVLNVIAGILGVITIGLWIASIISLGVLSPLAGTLTAITLAIGAVTLALDLINMIVLQPAVTLFRALHTFTSAADPREVVADGQLLSQAAANNGGAIGGVLSAKASNIGGPRPNPQAPESTTRVDDTPPPAGGDGPRVDFEAHPQPPEVPPPAQVLPDVGTAPSRPPVDVEAPVQPTRPPIEAETAAVPVRPAAETDVPAPPARPAAEVEAPAAAVRPEATEVPAVAARPPAVGDTPAAAARPTETETAAQPARTPEQPVLPGLEAAMAAPPQRRPEPVLQPRGPQVEPDIVLPLEQPRPEIGPSDVGYAEVHRLQEPRGGVNRAQESEHIMPGKQWETVMTPRRPDGTTGDPIYVSQTGRHYQNDITLRVEALLAKWKTNRGANSDKRRIDALKARAANGQPINVIEDIYLPAIEQTNQARLNTPGTQVTEGQIVWVATAELGHKFDIGAGDVPTGATNRNRRAELQAVGELTKAEGGIQDIDWDATFGGSRESGTQLGMFPGTETPPSAAPRPMEQTSFPFPEPAPRGQTALDFNRPPAPPSPPPETVTAPDIAAAPVTAPAEGSAVPASGAQLPLAGIEPAAARDVTPDVIPSAGAAAAPTATIAAQGARAGTREPEETAPRSASTAEITTQAATAAASGRGPESEQSMLTRFFPILAAGQHGPSPEEQQAEFNAQFAADFPPFQGVERANPAYTDPPCTPAQIEAIRGHIAELRQARAQTTHAERQMEGQMARHEANQQPLAQTTETVEAGAAASEEHTGEVESTAEANAGQQERQTEVNEAVSHYADHQSDIDSLRTPVRAFQGMMDLASYLPDDAGDAMADMNRDATNMLASFDEMDAAMADQGTSGGECVAQLESDAGEIEGANTMAGETNATLASATTDAAELESRNDAALSQATDRRDAATDATSQIDANIEEQEAEAASLSQQLQSWAQEHRAARLAAVDATAGRVGGLSLTVTAVHPEVGE